MSHDCHNEKLFDVIIKRLDNIEEKLDNLLQFKWRVVGAITVVSVLSTLVCNYLF